MIIVLLLLFVGAVAADDGNYFHLNLVLSCYPLFETHVYTPYFSNHSLYSISIVFLVSGFYKLYRYYVERKQNIYIAFQRIVQCNSHCATFHRFVQCNN